jgi:2-hydroxychromene-2-carboxylate isomerase
MSGASLDWYFDFVSPFSYLQSAQLGEFAAHARVTCRPVLFAGLLKHFDNIGPAEIAPKRRWTFEHVAWLAQAHGIPLTLPPLHPFVPLRLLRLSIVLGGSIDIVQQLFAFVWRDGRLPTDDEAFGQLLERHGVAWTDLDAPTVKDALRANTEAAAAAGVFGVPSAVIDGEVFWGFDATPMILARLDGDPFFESPALAAARELPQGVQRAR